MTCAFALLKAGASVERTAAESLLVPAAGQDARQGFTTGTHLMPGECVS